jgi:hypothetical protein
MWIADPRPSTMVFTPTYVEYNTYRVQAQPYVILLQDPRSTNNIIKFSVKPPRIRSHTRGDEAWNPWWRTALLVQSPDILPLPNMSDNNIGHTNGYLHLAIQQAKTTTEVFLSSIQELKTAHTQSLTTLKQAPNGSFILTHPKKDTSTQTTNYIISMADLATYVMLATLTYPTKVTLSTNPITRGQIRHQIATLNLTAHNRSILGRTYAQLLVDPDITQLNNKLTPLQYNQMKGLIGRHSDKIAWATTLMGHTDSKQTRKAYWIMSWKTPPQPKRPPKTRKDPYLNTLPPKHTRQPKQRKGEDATDGQADSKPTQIDASETSSGRKAADSTE